VKISSASRYSRVVGRVGRQRIRKKFAEEEKEVE
jgi:hypothetical protein